MKGALWTKEEDHSLLADFGQGMSLAQLSQKHDRTEAAITTRLQRFGRLVYNPESDCFHKVDPLPWGFPK